MIEIVDKEHAGELSRFIQGHPKGHFLQTPQWAEVKREWEYLGVLCRGEQGEIRGAVSVLIRKMPGLPWRMMYAPRGPVCDPEDTGTLQELTDGIRRLAKEKKGYLFKIDPDIKAENTAFADTMKALGYRSAGATSGFETIQPRFVFRLDIKGRTEEEVLAGFHGKTRYNIRVAVKNNVEVRLCGKEALGDFVRIMRTTGERDGFSTRPQWYFERMLDKMGDMARLYMAYYEGKAVAGTLALHFGDKTWYLYGASDNASRNVMPNYLLQWEMIRWALENGSAIYDFRGVSGDLSPENPLYGLYRFKKGFNGEFTEFGGEYDLVLKPGAKKIVDFGMHAVTRLRKLRHRRHKPASSGAAGD